jgi:transposase
MPALILRPPTDAEWRVINRLATSRTAPAALVRRGQLLKHLAQGASAPQAAALVGALTAETARNVLKGFNQEGLKVLEDKPRSGRPPRLSEPDLGRLVLLAQSQPQEGIEETSGACHWTLDTLLAAAHQEGILIGRTHLWEVLHQEGVRWWRRSRSWLVSEDPELPQKRGISLASTPALPRGVR